MPNATFAARAFVAAGWILLLCTQDMLRAADVGNDVAAPTDFVPGDRAAENTFLGDWQGKWEKGWPAEVVAQVIPRGDDVYTIRFLPEFDQRCPPLAVVEAKTEGGELRFHQDGWTGSVEGKRLAGTGILRGKPTDFNLTKMTRLSPRLGVEPPADAVVLFDGGSLAQWESDGRGDVTEITWKQIEGFVRVWPPLAEHAFAAAIRTRQAWSSFQLHLEFRLPLIAAATGQTRGNSGVIIEEFEFYEVQILDSYGLPGYWDETGAIYNKEAPKVNMCDPPGQWQSYDITYHGPKFDDAGRLIAKPRITVNLNGKRIHNDVELRYSDGAVKTRREKPESKMPGRITLQHHGDPIDFRNIWIVPL